MSYPTGMPLWFNLDVYFALIDQYIASDEVEIAMYLLENPPSYYRDHPPKRLIETREALHRQTWTSSQYVGLYKDIPENSESEWPSRMDVLEGMLTDCTHIMELGPGGLRVKDSLIKRGHNISYEYISLDGSEILKRAPVNATVIFVCQEIIEHLKDPTEIFQNYLKFKKPADKILITTPLYTYAGGMPEWRDRPLGHLRTYSPSILHETVAKMFRGFNWSIQLSETINLVGEKA